MGTSLGIIIGCSIFILFSIGALIAFITVGAVGTSWYVNGPQNPDIDSKTECLLLSKGEITDTCPLAGETGAYYTCYIQYYDVTYMIFNGTKISNRIRTEGNANKPNYEVKYIHLKLSNSFM